MAVLTVQDVGDGLDAVSLVAASAGGDQVPQGIENANHHLDGVFLVVDNGHTAAQTVTVENRPEVSVPAGALAVIPCNQGVYPGNLLAVTYGSVTALTVGAIRI